MAEIELGWAAIDKFTNKPYPGAAYGSGTKLYKSEKIAIAALRPQGSENFTFHRVAVNLNGESKTT